MLVKTFKAPDMPEAMRLVKAEFGPDAMIISSRREKRKGLLGFCFKPVYEVIAALDRVPQAPAPVSPPARAEKRQEGNTYDEFQKSMLAPLARELKELREMVQSLSFRQEERKPAPLPLENPPLPGRLHRSELEELKGLLLRPAESRESAPDEARTPPASPTKGKTSRRKQLDTLFEELRLGGVGEEESRSLVKTVEFLASRGESDKRLRERLKESIASQVQCEEPFVKKQGGQRIMALVGPTGVGKTTTIAKLAALAYKQGATVALITIDTFRIGAMEQLRTYAGILGMPLEVAASPDELKRAIAAHRDKQLILIDTAGRNPRDLERLNELKEFLQVHPSIETHLCLSVTTRDAELSRSVDQFGHLPVNRLLFTKLDECDSFGSIINVHLQERHPLSYFTTGQHVPDDIEPATAGKVADLIVREMKA